MLDIWTAHFLNRLKVLIMRAQAKLHTTIVRAACRARRCANPAAAAHRKLSSSSSSAREEAASSFERDGLVAPDALAALIEAMPPTRVSINQLSQAARNASQRQSILNAAFMHSELLARRAVMLRQLQQFPSELADSAGVAELARMYQQRLGNLLKLPQPRTVEDEERFASSMERAQPVQLGETRKAFGMSLAAMAAARKCGKLPRGEQVEIDQHIDRFFLSRVGIRFLVKHYLACRNPTDGYLGTIQIRCCEPAGSEPTPAGSEPTPAGSEPTAGHVTWPGHVVT